MVDRIAVVGGKRTPMCKSGGTLAGYQADTLAAFLVRELLKELSFPTEKIDQVVF